MTEGERVVSKLVVVLSQKARASQQGGAAA